MTKKVLKQGAGRKPRVKKKASRASSRQELNLLMRSAVFTNWAKSRERQIWYLPAKPAGRVARHSRSRQEHVGEHSWQLAMMAWIAIEAFNLPLDVHKAIKYALVHDAGSEWYSGDTPAFRKNGNGCAEVSCRNKKAELEKQSRERLRRGVGSNLPFIMKHIDDYDAGVDDEAWFVNALDKLLADINILQDSGYTNKKLGADLPTVDLYKRTRTERHPRVLAWYKELFAIWIRNETKLFPTRRKTTQGAVS